jgi:hypothetical protein
MNEATRILTMKPATITFSVLALLVLGHSAPGAVPKQAGALQAVHRAGQTFVTFADPEDTFGDAPTWGQVRQYRSQADRKIRYRIYRHDKPIDTANIGQAKLLAEVEPLSGINVNGWSFERLVNQIIFGNEDQGELGKYGPFDKLGPDSPEAQKLVLPRLAIEDGKPLASGRGLFVHSAAEKGQAYYAVTASAGGEENRTEFGPANSLAAPVNEGPAVWQPVEQAEGQPFGYDFLGKRHFYVTWVAPPLAPKPMYFNWSVLVPPNCTSPAPVELYFHAPGGSYARPPQKFLAKSIQICPHDYPFSGWYGYNDALFTGGKAEQGKVQPYTIRRIDAFLDWARTRFPVDATRTIAVGGDGAMMMALYRPKLLAYVISPGFDGLQLNPKVAKQFEAAWGPRAANIVDDQGRGEWGWGEPDVVLAGTRLPNNKDNKAAAPKVAPDATGAAADLPLIICGGRSWGVDPGYARGRGRLSYAVQGTRHPFYGRWGWRNADYPAKFTGLWYGLDIANDTPLPAITNCSTDVDSEAEGNANGWINWQQVSDTAESFEATFIGRGNTFTLTPRRLSKFKIAPGETIVWEASAVEVEPRTREAKPAPQTGQVKADSHGVVTVPNLAIPKGWGLRVKMAKGKQPA